LHNVGLYPVQILESFAVIILFFILFYFYQKPHKKGVIFAGYLLGYGLIRFGLEYLRFDDRGTGLFGFSPSQIIAIILIVISVFLFKRKER